MHDKRAISGTVAILIVIVAVIIIGGVYWYVTRPPPVTEVKIGAVYPLTGPIAPHGKTIKDTIDWYFEGINAAGGIKSLGGIPVKLIWADSEGDPKVGASEIERLITTEKVHMLIGCYQSAVTITAAEVAQRYKIPMHIYAGSDPILQQGYDYVFRSHSSVAMFARPPVVFYRDAGIKNVAIINENTMFGHTTGTAYEKYCEDFGIDVVLHEEYDAKAVDFTPLVTKLKAANPEAILACGYLADSVKIITTIKEQGLNVKAIAGAEGGHGMVDFVELLGDDAEYVMVGVTCPMDVKLPETIDFFSRYRAKFGKDPDTIAGMAVQQAETVYHVLEAAGSLDPEDLREAFYKIDFVSSIGRVKFQKEEVEFGLGPMLNQNPYAMAGLQQVQNGKHITVAVYPADVYSPDIVPGRPIFPMPPWEER
ncbi:MAG: ABC transporter substrate-binding protein [Candidatus Bathyarchaeia archaeon]